MVDFNGTLYMLSATRLETVKCRVLSKIVTGFVVPMLWWLNDGLVSEFVGWCSNMVHSSLEEDSDKEHSE